MKITESLFKTYYNEATQKVTALFNRVWNVVKEFFESCARCLFCKDAHFKDLPSDKVTLPVKDGPASPRIQIVPSPVAPQAPQASSSSSSSAVAAQANATPTSKKETPPPSAPFSLQTASSSSSSAQAPARTASTLTKDQPPPSASSSSQMANSSRAPSKINIIQNKSHSYDGADFVEHRGSGWIIENDFASNEVEFYAMATLNSLWKKLEEGGDLALTPLIDACQKEAEEVCDKFCNDDDVENFTEAGMERFLDSFKCVNGNPNLVSGSNISKEVELFAEQIETIGGGLICRKSQDGRPIPFASLLIDKRGDKPCFYLGFYGFRYTGFAVASYSKQYPTHGRFSCIRVCSSKDESSLTSFLGQDSKTEFVSLFPFVKTR